MSSALRVVAYVLVAILGTAELFVLWLVVNPDVPADYRAYFIDHTTTCANIPASGVYAGGMVSFYPDGRDQAKPVKVCGWEGPAGDGTHAVGTSSRLRFAVQEPVTDPVLALEMVAVDKAGSAGQRVSVLLNGEPLGELAVHSGEPQDFTLPLGSQPVAPGTYEITFEFSEALQVGPSDPETRWRSIRLGAAGIVSRRDAGA